MPPRPWSPAIRVRPAVHRRGATRPIAPSAGGEPFRLLVFGGSQGAQFFSDAVPPAIAAAARGRAQPAGQVTQQARAEDDGTRAQAPMPSSASTAEVSPFFGDMAAAHGRRPSGRSRAPAPRPSPRSP